MPRSQPPAAAISTTCKRMMSDGPILTGENPEVDAQARAIYWGTRLWLHAFAVLHKPRWLERKPLLLTYQPRGARVMWFLQENPW